MKITRNYKHTIDKEIESLLETMRRMDPASAEYSTIADNLDKLCKAQAKTREFRKGISADTIITVAGSLIGSLGGILLILKHEEVNVITSKAIGWVIKGRV